MQKCARCKIDILGNKRCCPLCGGKLSGVPEEDPFPMVPRGKLRRTTFIRINAFLLVIFEAVMITIAVSMGRLLPWMPLAMLAGVAVFADIISLLYFRNNIMKLTVNQIYVGMAVCFVVDWFTSFHGWSVVWVLPSCFAFCMIWILFIGVILKYHPRDIMMYLLLNFVLSLGQIFFLRRNMNLFPYPVYISIAFETVVMAGVLIFRGRMFRDMTERFFNV